METPLHGQLEPLSFLLGTWRGRGRGLYPTIEDFTYEEESTFTHTGRPFLVYSQRTWHPESGQPMHSETGFLRSIGDQRIEIVLSHAFGIAEVGEGTVWETQVETRTTAVFGTSTAKEVGAITRSLELRDDTLHYTIGMQFGEHLLQDHLFAQLTKTG